MDHAQKSLELHAQLKGKLEIVSRVSLNDKTDLALAYTPGVAQPCLEIQKDISKSFTLTRRWNTVAVVTDGTAVLGLGDIGPEAGMPVMEGKCILHCCCSKSWNEAISWGVLPSYQRRPQSLPASSPVRPSPHFSSVSAMESNAASFSCLEITVFVPHNLSQTA